LYGEHKGTWDVGLFAHSYPLLSMRDEAVLMVENLKGKKIRGGRNMTGKMVSFLPA